MPPLCPFVPPCTAFVQCLAVVLMSCVVGLGALSGIVFLLLVTMVFYRRAENRRSKEMKELIKAGVTKVDF